MPDQNTEPAVLSAEEKDAFLAWFSSERFDAAYSRGAEQSHAATWLEARSFYLATITAMQAEIAAEDVKAPDYFARAVRTRLRLPDTVDRNNAREVLEFATRSSYPTAPDPLLAVAHSAAQIIAAMHDAMHDAVDEMRTKGAEISKLRDLIQRIELDLDACLLDADLTMSQVMASVLMLIRERIREAAAQKENGE